MLALWKPIVSCFPIACRRTRRHRYRYSNGVYCKAEDQDQQLQFAIDPGVSVNKKKVLIVGSGWAGLAAANHLIKQGFDVTVLEGGYEFGPKNKTLTPDDIGIQGFWYPYQNIFSLVDELDIKPFTNWTSSAQYSKEGLEVEFPIFQNEAQLPTPLGTLLYTKFSRLPLIDRLTVLPLTVAVIDFDNTDMSWQKYDPLTARELLRQFGCSERLYQDVVASLLQVGLYASPEQCSAAATLAMLNYFVFSHQINFDSSWCRGPARKQIFEPWTRSLKEEGCKFLEGRKVTDMFFNEETGCISEVICDKESFRADAVILAVGVSTLQDIIQNSATLCSRDEFLRHLKLSSIDLLTVKLQFDKKVSIRKARNVCSIYDDANAFTFFDLNMIYDEYKDDPFTTIQADFYNASDLLPLKDDKLVEKAVISISKCVKDFENATVIDKDIGRYPKSLTHFSPGSYKYMMRGSTSFPNLFMAGDWVVTRHGSCAQVQYIHLSGWIRYGGEIIFNHETFQTLPKCARLNQLAIGDVHLHHAFRI